MLVEVLGALVILLTALVLLLLAGSSQDKKQKLPPATSPPKRQEHPGSQQIPREVEAMREYHRRYQRAYLAFHKAQRAALQRQRRVQRYVQYQRFLLEVFPEMGDPAARGRVIRHILLQLVGQLFGGGDISPEWRRQISEFLQSANGTFEAKRQLIAWRSVKLAEIEAQFAAGEISQEERAAAMELVEEVFVEAMQTISF